MKVLFVASECTPFVKTGGLADVAGTLPNALARLGMDVRVIIPKYRDIPEHWKEQMTHLLYFHVNLGWRRQYCGIHYMQRNDVTYYFIDNEFYFGRDSVYGSGAEEGERFGFFCRAVLESIQHLGFRPDLIHCNDWQTGMIPALLKTQYTDIPFYRNIKTLFTVHNLRYQGIFAWNQISDLLGIPDMYFAPDMLEYFGCASFMKGGLVFSDRISTVSPTYATEIQTPYYGERLDGMIRARHGDLSGILNGIDPNEYSPENDMWLPAHFDAQDFEGKASCKADLQRELGLDIRPDVPLIAMITRLTDQKGLDLVECVLDDIMRNDVQFVILGKGDEHYQELFSWAAWRYQGRLATRIEINNPLSHRLYAASDIMLIPSQFEPCGLTQMISMRFGTIPVVRETGGLKDSVIAYNQYTQEGNGFSFANYNAHEMLFTLQRAISVYYDKEAWLSLMKRAMDSDFSWDVSAEHYARLYDSILCRFDSLILANGPEPVKKDSIAENVSHETSTLPSTENAAEAKPVDDAMRRKSEEEAPAKKTTRKKSAASATADDESPVVKKRGRPRKSEVTESGSTAKKTSASSKAKSASRTTTTKTTAAKKKKTAEPKPDNE